MAKQQQQTRNDENRTGGTPTAFGMVSSGSDRPQDQSAGSVIDRADSSDPAVEQGGTQGSSGAQASGRTGGERDESRGNGQNGGQGGNGGREGASMRSNEQDGDGRGRQERSGQAQSHGQGQSGQQGSPGREQSYGQGQSFGQDQSRGQGQAYGQGQSQQQGGRRRQWRQKPQIARDVMTRNPRTVKPTDPVQQIAQLMVDEDTGIIPVVDGTRLVGVVTDRDIVCRLIAQGTDLKGAKASDVMTAEVECVTEDDSLQDVLEVMGENQIRRVGVVGKDDRLVGIISMADLAREADVDERLQDAFEEISSRRSFWSKMR
jgi:CBS domain-containing protein